MAPPFAAIPFSINKFSRYKVTPELTMNICMLLPSMVAVPPLSTLKIRFLLMLRLFSVKVLPVVSIIVSPDNAALIASAIVP